MEKVIFANIEAERVKSGMSKKEIAKILGVSSRSYYNYTHGISPIPSRTLKELSKTFKCSIDYLLT